MRTLPQSGWPVQTQIVKFMHRFPVKQLGQQQPHAHCCDMRHAAPGGFADVGAQPRLYGGGVGKPGVVETVQVKLERLILDNIRRLAGHGEMRQLRLAAQVQPAQLERSPQVGAKKRRRDAHANFFALGQAQNRKQQRRLVLVHISRRFAQ
jgi:hypothetical protein